MHGKGKGSEKLVRSTTAAPRRKISILFRAKDRHNGLAVMEEQQERSDTRIAGKDESIAAMVRSAPKRHI